MKKSIASTAILALSASAGHAQATKSEFSTLMTPHSLISMAPNGEQLELACSSESSILLTSCYAYIHGALDGLNQGIFQETRQSGLHP